MANYRFAKPYYNVTSIANEIAVEEAYNCYFEAIPSGGFAVRRRPGLSFKEYSFTPSSEGRGLYWSDRNNELYVATSADVCFKPSSLASQQQLATWTDRNRPAVFAEGQQLDLSSLIYVVNGGLINWIDVTTNHAWLEIGPLTTPEGPDILCSHIVMMNNRFYANDTDATKNQDFYITDVDPGTGLMDQLYWLSATNPWRAAQKPDYIRGVFTGWNEIYIWGSQACEVWQEDGVNPISPLVGSLIEIGLEAPYSVQMADNTFFALVTLNGKRAVCKISGRGPTIISEPIANILQSYLTVSDAIGSLCFAGGTNFYVLSLPTEGATWAYDFKNDVWTQWSSWNVSLGVHEIFKAPFMVYAINWNLHLAQGFDGTLYTMSRDVTADAPDNAPIRSSVRTGWVDHGSWDRKRCDQLIVKLQGYAPRSATVLLRTRDDGRPEWSNYIEINVQAGPDGQNDHFCKLNRMGMFRSRQYEFTMTDNADLAIVGMEIDVTRMRN